MNEILVGDVRERLAELPDACCHMAVTSPPYWGLRDYGVAGQIGLEPTPEEFIAKLVDVFRSVRRVLRDDGTIWVNMGDGYNAFNGGAGPSSALSKTQSAARPQLPTGFGLRNRELDAGQMLGMPWRLAFALQADGWILRQDVIWHKPNPMPESVSGTRWERHRIKVGPGERTAEQGYAAAQGGRDHPHGGVVAAPAPKWQDCPGCPKCEPNGGLVLRRGSGRCTKAHEYLFLFAKTDRYYYDCEAVKSAVSNATKARCEAGFNPAHGDDANHYGDGFQRGDGYALHAANLRDVWRIPTQAFPGAHFATYPENLVKPCILAGTAQKNCPKCGAPWARVLEKAKRFESGSGRSGNQIAGKNGTACQGGGDTGDIRKGPCLSTNTIGWRPTCQCGEAGSARAVVLDPFMGSGTTAIVATMTGRDWIGCELNPKYAAIAENRIRETCGLFSTAPVREGVAE